MKKIDICLSPDNNYVIPCSVAIQSLCINTCDFCKVNIHILDGGLTSENKRMLEQIVCLHKSATIRFVKVNDQKFKEFYTSNWGTAATYRFQIGDLLYDLDRVLYIDCDVIICKSVEDLFFSDLGDNIIGMVPDIWHKKQKQRFPEKKQPYFNTGVCLFDLKKWRELDVANMLIDFYRKNKDVCWFPDQDPINSVLDGNILQLDYRFNFCYHWDKNEYFETFGDRDVKDAVIVHYIFNKPWWSSCIHPYAKLYFDYLNTIPVSIRKRAKFFVKQKIDTATIYVFGIPILRMSNYFTIKEYKFLGCIPLLSIQISRGEANFLLFNIIPIFRIKSANGMMLKDKVVVMNNIRYSDEYRI